jgi:hypothetical protein
MHVCMYVNVQKNRKSNKNCLSCVNVTPVVSFHPVRIIIISVNTNGFSELSEMIITINSSTHVKPNYWHGSPTSRKQYAVC